MQGLLAQKCVDVPHVNQKHRTLYTIYTPNAVVELLPHQYFCQDHGVRSVYTIAHRNICMPRYTGTTSDVLVARASVSCGTLPGPHPGS